MIELVLCSQSGDAIKSWVSQLAGEMVSVNHFLAFCYLYRYICMWMESDFQIIECYHGVVFIGVKIIVTIFMRYIKMRQLVERHE